MQVRCPECQETLRDDQLDHPTEISCDSCGGRFSLIRGDETICLQTGETSAAAPTSIAHFRLIRRLGSGAFGVVWEAQDEKLDRRVAIKVPRGGSAGDVQFLREAQAAAQLRHANIVSIHEVGLHGEAIYIVCDFIDGMPLSELIGDRRFDPREAAELCVILAEALQHAHDAGVVHRDLKPANIMMDTDKPYIMDFGLAKRNVAEVTMTLDGKIMGTPAYMSPEQARGEANTVDGRSDVYSLGVILFELLTRELPFRGNLRMLIDQVIQDDPPSLRKFNSNVPRDLETICLKCLRKTPDARYASAASLAADLKRWINREPIEARPFTKPERFVRWCQRRPMVATLAATVVFVTVLGFSGVTWQWRKAEVLRAQAEENFMESERQRAKRDANFETALSAVDKMLTYIGEKSLAEVPRMQRVRKQMLEDAAQFYTGFVSEKSDDPDILVESARSYIRVADIRQSLDEQAECEAAYNKAIEILDGLNITHQDRVDVQENLATALYSRSVFYYRGNRIEEALRDVEAAIAIRQSLSNSLEDDEANRVQLAMLTGQLGVCRSKTSALEQAEAEMRDGLSMFSELGDSEEKRWREASLRLYLAILQVEKTMETADAESMVSAAIRSMEVLVQEKQWNRDYRTQLANCKRLLAVLLLSLNRSEDAEAQFAEHVTVRKQLVEDFPHIPSYQHDYSGAIADLAVLYARAGRLPQAQEKLKEAIETQERLVSEVPYPEYRRTLATNCTNLGAMLTNSAAPLEAEPYMLLALELRQELMNEFPDVELYKHQVSISAANLANAIMLADKEAFGEVGSERLQEADRLLALALDLGDTLINVENPNPIYRHKQAIAYRIRGALWADIEPEKSCEALSESIQLMRALKNEIPQDFRFAHQLHYSLDQLAESLLTLERYEEAEQSAREANDIVKTLAETTGIFQFRTDYAINTRKLGELLEEIGDDIPARDAYSRAIEMSTAILEEHADNPASSEQLAHAHSALALLLATSSNADVRQPEKAVEHAEKALVLKDDSFFNGTVGITLYVVGELEEAVKAFSTARQLRPQIDATADMYHVMALAQLGHIDEALDVFNAAIEAAEAGDIEFPASWLQSEAYAMLE